MRPQDTQMASGSDPGPTIESMVTITGAEYESMRAALREARGFIDDHSEPWYKRGQELLKQIDEALA